jgi:hypothetical protein
MVVSYRACPVAEQFCRTDFQSVRQEDGLQSVRQEDGLQIRPTESVLGVSLAGLAAQAADEIGHVRRQGRRPP